MDFTGSLFQQKTKAICVMDNDSCFGNTTFHYIHQNPVKAGMVDRMEDWEFSSFKDYAGLRDQKICNCRLACDLLDMDINTFYQDSYNVINDDSIDRRIQKPASGSIYFPRTWDTGEYLFSNAK